MITFTLCLLALVAGYFIYGRFIEHVFGPDDRKTPAITKADGVDYIPLPTWKIFMIQFLNIAGLGPILRCNHGSEIRFGILSVDSVRKYFCRSGARLFCRNAFVAQRGREPAGDYRPLSGRDYQAG